MQQITSTQNEYIKRLCRLKTASGRRESGLFLIEGDKLCKEALRSGFPVVKCLFTGQQQNNPVLSEIGAGDQILISDHVAKKLTSLDSCPGIFIVLKQHEPVLGASPAFILALDHLADPSNLGAILRSAEAFGAGLVYLSDECVDLYSPKVLRGAMGSVFRVPVFRGNLTAFLSEKKKAGYRIYGAGLDHRYLQLQELAFGEPSIVVIGNESNGISEPIMALCEQGVWIPMLGKNESLNAAVAASIILWEQSKWR